MALDDGSLADGVDVSTPNVARMYDYFLGGAHNFTADRDAAARAVAAMPQIPRMAQANRAFLQRAVRFCVNAGVRQFLDLGSGIPTVGHVHEIAHAVDPAVLVAYVDIEPVAVAHTRHLLHGLATATVTQADMTDPATVLSAPGVVGLLDFTRPVAVLAVAVLHFVPDDSDPRGVLAAYRDAVPPGSLLVLSHGGDDYDRPDRMDALHKVYQRTSTPGQRRSRADIVALLGDWELIEPGLVDVTAWHPDEPTPVPERARVWGAVARR